MIAPKLLKPLLGEKSETDNRGMDETVIYPDGWNGQGYTVSYAEVVMLLENFLENNIEDFKAVKIEVIKEDN